MYEAILETVLGGFFICIWIIISIACFSRIPTLLEDRHHPLASPLVPAKVITMILLGLWAFSYGVLREFELFSPSSLWQIGPTTVHHILVLQILRPAAITLFCFIISTPALPLNSELYFKQNYYHNHSNGNGNRNDDQHISIVQSRDSNEVNIIPIHSEKKYHHHHHHDLSSLSPSLFFPIEQDKNYSIKDIATCTQIKKRESNISGELTHNMDIYSESIINPMGLDFTYCTSSTSNISNINKNNNSNNTYIPFSEIKYYSEESIEGKKKEDWKIHNMKNYIKEREIYDPLEGTIRHESICSDGLILDNKKVKGVNNNNNSAYIFKNRIIKYSTIICYWIIGRIPPEDHNNNNNEEGGGENSFNIINLWSRQLLWRLSLRIRLYIPLWFISIIITFIFIIISFKGELHNCIKRNSETEPCLKSGVDTNSISRIYIPRSITIINIINNSFLLLLWVYCGIQYLNYIKNIYTKQNFVRIYITGILLFILQIIYGFMQLFDDIRYNEIIKVIMIIFENICDCTLVGLIALRLGSGKRQMPHWYLLLKSILSYNLQKTQGNRYELS